MKVVGITSTAILSLLFGIVAPVYAQHEQQGEKQDHPEKPQAAQHEQARPEQQHAQQQEHAQQQQRQAKPEQQQQHAQQQQRQDQNKQQEHPQKQQRQAKSEPQQQHAQQQQRQDQNKQQEHAQQQQRQDQNRQQQVAQQRGHEQPQRTQEQRRVEQTAWQQHRAGNWQSDHRTWQQRGGYIGYRIPDDRFRGYFGSAHGFRIEGLPFLVVGGYPRFQYGGYWFSLVDPWPGSWANNWYDTDDVYVTYVDNGYYLFNRRYPTTGIAISISM